MIGVVVTIIYLDRIAAITSNTDHSECMQKKEVGEWKKWRESGKSNESGAM
jgi:hypothetical protein